MHFIAKFQFHVPYYNTCFSTILCSVSVLQQKSTLFMNKLRTSREQTDTAQTLAYRHYHRYASDTPQIREYVTRLLIVTFTWRIRSTCCVALLYMALTYARRIRTAALWYVLVKVCQLYELCIEECELRILFNLGC